MAAYFCPKTGIRLKEPGIAKSAGGNAEEYKSEAKSPPPKESKPARTKRAKTEEKD